MEKKTLSLFGMLAATAMIGAVASSAVADDAKASKKEKCYGIAAKGKNDCGTKVHSCAGLASVEADPVEWVLVPQGLCERIAGGSLTPKNGSGAKS